MLYLDQLSGGVVAECALVQGHDSDCGFVLVLGDGDGRWGGRVGARGGDGDHPCLAFGRECWMGTSSMGSCGPCEETSDSVVHHDGWEKGWEDG